MKVYLIGQKGIPAKFGGVEKHVEELSVRLAKGGHEVFVYARPNYTDPNLKTFQGVNLINLPSIGTKHLDAISHTFMACLDVARRDADIVHFHSIGPSSLLWLVKLLKPGVPVIATFHTRCYFHQKWGWFARAYLKFGEMIANTVSDFTIAVSESLAQYAKDSYGRDAKYIPNGVSLLELKEASVIKQWGLEKDSYILTVSRLVKHKGVHHLIEAYNQLKTDKKLVIVGGGAFSDDYVKELKFLADGNKNIIFTGSQSGRVLEELFSNAYLFVQPSESEGLSIALLEAMSYRRATLVSDIPENLEAIFGTGFSFQDKNVDDLTLKLDYLLKNPQIVASSGPRGYERVKDYYSWENINSEVLNVYREQIIKKEKGYVRGKMKQVKKFVSFLF